MARSDPDAEPVPVDAPPVSPPTVDADGVPEKCLSLTIRADWGHFRRIDRTVTKQTYRLPPRTTIAGMLAAIVGSRRDSYYDVFAPGVSAVAVEPVGEIRTVTEPMLGLSTNPKAEKGKGRLASAGGTGKKTVKVRYPDGTEPRQLHSYELLVNPAYRVDVAVEDESFYRVLAGRLDAGTAHYPLSMGLSEYLAWVEFHGEFTVERRSDETSEVDSAVPVGAGSVLPHEGIRTHVERMPAFMEADENGRRTTGFGEYTFTTGDERIEIRTDEVTPARVGDRTVVFE
jgi:CRISPR-associated protein Cas5h